MDALEVLILGASKYEFKEENSDRQVKGCTVHYVQLTEGDNDNAVGYSPAKATLPYDYFEKFQGFKFPILADATITLQLSNKRNPIKVTGFDFKGSYELG